jgi:hypothetical protein
VTQRYAFAFQRPPSRLRRWHLLAVGAAAGAGIALAVTAAWADTGHSFAEEACAVLRAGGDLDPSQPVDVVVQHGGQLGAVRFRCPPDTPGRFLPPALVTVVYPP